jgi:hypothetical protein
MKPVKALIDSFGLDYVLILRLRPNGQRAFDDLANFQQWHEKVCFIPALPIIAQYLLARELNPNWGDLINPLINWE